ncbi:HAD-superfamily phosphatase [Saccharata proteae CBS 121410]|uniref:HAD-superfamily phosphatase n=1 Tax=Saccharata proteae CBS 121410 TaxID=1314787 RepID=A0A9P4LXR9_9PEZI|nr:HAD-superfamily phosphatase [Saccharata proteae CBS 121410]
MNLSGTLNVFKLFLQPTLCLPHHTVSTFNQLPIPLSKALIGKDGEKAADIRAVVLDKDNCFAVPHTNEVYPEYKEKFQQLRKAYPGSRLLIVSNTAGTQSDRSFAEAELLERNTGVKVLRHNTKKPGCRSEVLEYFRNSPDSGVTSPSQIAIVGDRLFTDVMMANMMGAHGFWTKDGVVGPKSFFAKMEHRLAGFLLRRGYSPPDPRSSFE